GRTRPCRADGLHRVLAGAQRLWPRFHRARTRRICRARRHSRSVSGRPRSAGAVRFFRRQPGIDPLVRCGNPAHAFGHALARSGSDLGIPAGYRDHPGMEHWLPLFQERMDTLFDYLGDAPVAIEPQSEDAARERFKQIADYYEARREAMEHPGGGAIYKPLPPDRLYLTEDEWAKRLDAAALA